MQNPIRTGYSWRSRRIPDLTQVNCSVWSRMDCFKPTNQTFEARWNWFVNPFIQLLTYDIWWYMRLSENYRKKKNSRLIIILPLKRPCWHFEHETLNFQLQYPKWGCGGCDVERKKLGSSHNKCSFDHEKLEIYIWTMGSESIGGFYDVDSCPMWHSPVPTNRKLSQGVICQIPTPSYPIWKIMFLIQWP